MTLDKYSFILKKARIPFILKVTTAALGLIFNIIATHFLSVEEFGTYSLALVIIIATVTLSKLGLDNTLVKYLAIAKTKNNPVLSNNYYSFSLLITFASTLLLLTLSIISKDFLIYVWGKPSLAPLFYYILAIVLANTFIVINSSAFKGSSLPGLSVLFNGFITLLFSTILIILFQPTKAISLIKILCISSYAACFLSFAIIFIRLKLKIALPKSAESVPEMFNSCIPLWLSSIVALIIQQSGLLVLGHYAALADIAIYAIALKISTMMSFILFAVNSVLAPKFAALYSNNKLKELRQLAITTNNTLLTIALLTSLALALLSSNILGLFGDNYARGSLWLQILIIGQLVNVGTGSAVTLLVMTNQERLHRNNTLITAILTITLASVLIPNYGALGAAITTALAMINQNLLSFYFASKLLTTKQNK